jgi:hypothetical protein
MTCGAVPVELARTVAGRGAGGERAAAVGAKCYGRLSVRSAGRAMCLRAAAGEAA